MFEVLKRWLRVFDRYLRLIGSIGRDLVTRPRYPRDAIEQFNSLGVDSLGVVLLTGTFTGLVLALQSGMTLDQFGARSAVGRLVGASMIKELGPVLTALMVTGRVGSGIAAELGAMAVTDQLAALRVLGIDPIRKLIVPRAVAVTLILPVLTVLGDAAGIFGGAAIVRLQFHLSSGTYWNNVVHGLSVSDLWMGVIKPVVFGFLLVTIACYVGLATGGGTQGVGRSTTQAVVAGSIVVLAADFFVTKILIGLLY